MPPENETRRTGLMKNEQEGKHRGPLFRQPVVRQSAGYQCLTSTPTSDSRLLPSRRHSMRQRDFQFQRVPSTSNNSTVPILAPRWTNRRGFIPNQILNPGQTSFPCKSTEVAARLTKICVEHQTEAVSLQENAGSRWKRSSTRKRSSLYDNVATVITSLWSRPRSSQVVSDAPSLKLSRTAPDHDKNYVKHKMTPLQLPFSFVKGEASSERMASMTKTRRRGALKTLGATKILKFHSKDVILQIPANNPGARCLKISLELVLICSILLYAIVFQRPCMLPGILYVCAYKILRTIWKWCHYFSSEPEAIESAMSRKRALKTIRFEMDKLLNGDVGRMALVGYLFFTEVPAADGPTFSASFIRTLSCQANHSWLMNVAERKGEDSDSDDTHTSILSRHK